MIRSSGRRSTRCGRSSPVSANRGREIALHLVAACAIGAAIVLGTVFDNRGTVRGEDISRALVVLAGAAALATLAAGLVSVRLARILPLAVYLVFSSTVWLDLVHGMGWMKPGWADLAGYASLVSIVLVAHVLLGRMQPMRAAWMTTAIAVAMAAGTGAIVARDLGWREKDAPHALNPLADWALKAMTAPTPARLPDILYIVPDRYASAETLEREYGADNEAFYRALERRGFDVERNARANYPRTELSLASTLNSTYLDPWREGTKSPPLDHRALYRMIEDNIAQRVLRTHGYRFHNYGNWWQPTRINRWAHVNEQGYEGYLARRTNEFERAVWRRVSVPGMRGGKRAGPRAKARRDPTVECARIARKMEALATFGNADRAVFAFTHVSIPHTPIVMGAHGQCLGERAWERRDGATDHAGFRRAWIEFLRYFNSSVLEVVDRQLQRRADGGRALIVVIQSDEGPHPPRMLGNTTGHRYSSFDRRETRIKAGTVNAIRIPGRTRNVLQDEPTPINNWRIILDAVLGTDTRRLPHRVFLPGDPDSFYDFREVTHEVLGRQWGLVPNG